MCVLLLLHRDHAEEQRFKVAPLAKEMALTFYREPPQAARALGQGTDKRTWNVGKMVQQLFF